VLADVEAADVDLIVFGGDVAAGPFPDETLDLVRSLQDRTRFVLGNADDQQDPFVSTFEEAVIVTVDGLGPTLFRHGSPRSVDEIVTRLTPEPLLRQMLEGVDERVVVIGHTHVQFNRVVDDRQIVNAGSVGMPYEGRRGAFWALLGPGIDLRCTEYDVDSAAEAIRRAGSVELAGWLVDPPSPDEASEFFERQAGR
jgi:predicted phosphodiesterase